MKPKTIGIIGGPGPLAGAMLMDRVLRVCMQQYGCYRDRDFPRILLISFPFSKMLTAEADIEKRMQRCIFIL